MCVAATRTTPPPRRQRGASARCSATIGHGVGVGLLNPRARVVAAFRRAGFALSRTPGPGTLARHLREVFDVLDVDCVIDVGANGGQYGRMLREREEVGFRGRIVSVEPAREPYARLLEASAGDPEWVTFNFGLGDSEEKTMLSVFSNDDFSSLHPLNVYGAERFGQTEVSKEEITVRRLDVVFDEFVAGCERVFLKSDTQGHDLEVLKGLGTKKVLGLQLELPLINIYDQTPGFTEAIETVEGLGFAPSGFFPISRSADRLRLIEMDGVFIADG